MVRFFLPLITLLFSLVTSLSISAAGATSYSSRFRESIGGINWLEFAPRSLVEQKLSPAAFPEETEIFCSIADQCVFGLTKGLVVGADAFGMLYFPVRKLFNPHFVSGSFQMLDVFGGFQILRSADHVSFANAQVGYKRLSYTNSYANSMVVQGLAIRINYAQRITGTYQQGLTFHAFPAIATSFSNTQHLSSNSTALERDYAQKTVKYMYRWLQTYPTYFVSLPADLEVANFSLHEDVKEPLRIYAHFEPSYSQTYMNIASSNYYEQIYENDVKLRFAGVATYESKKRPTSGRYAFRFDLGFDLTSSFPRENHSFDIPNVSPDRVPILLPYLDLQGSFQF